LPAPARVPVQGTTQKLRDTGLLSPAGDVRAGTPSLPEGLRISLAILSGPDQGKIIVLDRPKIVLGRSDSDIVLADPEISRQHAVVEIYADKFLVRDLNSTNGTFIGDRRITAEEVENQGEFRVGGSRMMLIVTTPAEE
jgi:S-DNA-T family DNA segregation ATPase FtsK/SpoIIIE